MRSTTDCARKGLILRRSAQRKRFHDGVNRPLRSRAAFNQGKAIKSETDRRHLRHPDLLSNLAGNGHVRPEGLRGATAPPRWSWRPESRWSATPADDSLPPTQEIPVWRAGCAQARAGPRNSVPPHGSRARDPPDRDHRATEQKTSVRLERAPRAHPLSEFDRFLSPSVLR